MIKQLSDDDDRLAAMQIMVMNLDERGPRQVWLFLVCVGGGGGGGEPKP